MAVPTFNSNSWYSVQNFGTKFYLSCNSISICGADESNLSTFERFQVVQLPAESPGGPAVYYIRPEARKTDDQNNPFCININEGQPFLSLCSNASATWGSGYWNGLDGTDGLFWFDNRVGEGKRLFLTDNGVWDFRDYSEGMDGSDKEKMRWGVASLADINDRAYSATPSAISGAAGTATAVPTDVTGSMTIFAATTTTPARNPNDPSSSSSSGSISTATPIPTASGSGSGSGTSSVVRSSTGTMTSSVAGATPTGGAGKLASSACLIAALLGVNAVLQLGQWVL